eukprot:15314954-Alexandrium_andersonii.AAC.1
MKHFIRNVCGSYTGDSQAALRDIAAHHARIVREVAEHTTAQRRTRSLNWQRSAQNTSLR